MIFQLSLRNRACEARDRMASPILCRLLCSARVSVVTSCFGQSIAPTEESHPCGLETGGVFWSETFAISRIGEGSPIVSASPPGKAEPPDRAGAHVCLTVGAAGEVVAVCGECGDARLLAAVIQSVRQWRFEPPTQDELWGNSVTTWLTFQWREHSAALILDRNDYPIDKENATQLVRAVPGVGSQIKRYPRLILEVDAYPQEGDGVFYLFHFYESGQDMNFTLGWYFVNAYTGEVWEAMEDQPIRTRGVRRVQKLLRQHLRIPITGVAGYEGLDPAVSYTREITDDPCADRPRSLGVR